MSARVVLTPAQVLDCQGDLLMRADAGPSAIFGRYMVEMMEARMGRSAGNLQYLLPALASAIRSGEAFYVTEDLATEAQRRARDEDRMPDSRPFDRNEPPTQTGFCYIEGGLRTREMRSATERSHLVVWGPVRVRTEYGEETTTGVWSFNDMLDPDETMAALDEVTLARIRKEIGRWSLVDVKMMFQDEQLGPVEIRPDAEMLAQLRAGELAKPSHITQSEGYRSIPDDDADCWWDNGGRHVVALWDLFNESVNVVTHGNAHLDRATARRAKRMNLPGRVTVVKLRRAKYPEHEWLGPHRVDWSHRWIVRRHKRMQPYGPGRSLRREIWIEAHEKGPHDKPMIQTAKVYRLDR